MKGDRSSDEQQQPWMKRETAATSSSHGRTKSSWSPVLAEGRQVQLVDVSDRKRQAPPHSPAAYCYQSHYRSQWAELYKQRTRVH
nr:hypothetical protein Iba_chr13dCG7510 [Ipomoea batatas]GME18661.1 hypothetical protein Iba_scaffold21040CG0280 [Ipomoea batatas]